jgi:hypothetical protein
MAAGYTTERGKVDMGEEGLGLRLSGVTLTRVTSRHCRLHDQIVCRGRCDGEQGRASGCTRGLKSGIMCLNHIHVDDHVSFLTLLMCILDLYEIT